MVRVTVWPQLLLVVMILRQSAAVSDHCSELQEEISRLKRDILSIRDLKNMIQRVADNCHEKLTKQILISQATDRNLTQSEAIISGLEKQLDEYKTKFQQSEADNSGLKKQLEIKEEVLKNNNETQTQLQTDIDGLTKSLNQTIQKLRETTQHVCRSLLDAAKSGDVNTVKILFKCSNDNCTDDDLYRNTPLTYAASNGHVAVVRVLLEGGANVDRADAVGDIALYLAAYFGHLDVCRLLLDWGAKVDHLGGGKHTALHYAALKGHLSVVKLLVERGADVSVKDEHVNTALHYAAMWGHLSVVKLLVERGADVSVKNEDGETASDVARSSGKLDVAAWLDSVSRG